MLFNQCILSSNIFQGLYIDKYVYLYFISTLILYNGYRSFYSEFSIIKKFCLLIISGLLELFVWISEQSKEVSCKSSSITRPKEGTCESVTAHVLEYACC